MADCLIACGSNQGDRWQLVQTARQWVGDLPDTCVLAMSPLVQTTPVGLAADSHSFVNAAMLVQTGLSPQRLMEQLLNIESSLGRDRNSASRDRPMDLDILLFRDPRGVNLVVSTADLQIPHPRMSFRRFVLQPALTIAPQMFHPLCHMTVAELVEHLDTAANKISVLIADARIAQQLVDRHKSSRWSPQLHFIDAASAMAAEAIDATDWSIHLFVEESRFLSCTDPKLRIVDRHFESSQELGFRGPCWMCPIDTAANLVSNVEIAIQSMQAHA